jgi:EpsI family protein
MTGRYRFLVVYLLLAGSWSYLWLHHDAPVPVGKRLAEFPAGQNRWRMTSQSRFSEQVLAALRPSDYLYRNYAGAEGRTICLYVGYHDGGKDSGEIHSPRNCLPGSGWQELSSTRMKLPTENGTINLVKAVYQKGETRELFFYWFQVQGQTIADEYTLKAAEILNSIVHRRRDAAFVRISMPLEGNYQATEAQGIGFIRDFYPLIKSHLPI